jgi:predicted Zn-ribbon and HTH transcriptional regulator
VSPSILLNNLDILLASMQCIFTSAFTRDAGLDGVKYDQTELFNQLWHNLMQSPRASTEQALIEHLEGIKNKFKDRLNVLQAQELQKIFSDIVDVYSALALQRFYLLKIPEQEQDTLQSIYDKAFAAADALEVVELEDSIVLTQELMNIEVTLQQLLERFFPYGNMNVPFNEYKKATVREDLLQVLAELPEVSEIHQVVKEVNQARAQNASEAIVLAEKKLQGFVAQLASIRQRLKREGDCLIERYKELSLSYKNQTERLGDKLHELQTLFNPLLQAYKYAVICKRFQGQLIFPAQGMAWWKMTQDINTLLKKFKTETNEVLDVYVHSAGDLNQLKQHLTYYRASLQSLETMGASVATTLSKIENIYAFMDAALTQAEKNISTAATHQNTVKEQVSNFFSQYKWSFFGGGFTGSTASTIVTVANVANPALALTAAVVGYIGGGAASAGIEYTVNKFRKK